MAKIKPLGKRVLIQRAKAQATKGGILLPDSAQEKPKEGVVVAIGPGELDKHGKLDPVSVKVGDKVLFSSYAGTEIKNHENGDEDYLVVSENDIFGILS